MIAVQFTKVESLVDDFCRLPFQSLLSNKINSSLGQHVVQKSAIGFANALLE